MHKRKKGDSEGKADKTSFRKKKVQRAGRNGWKGGGDEKKKEPKKKKKKDSGRIRRKDS